MNIGFFKFYFLTFLTTTVITTKRIAKIAKV